MKQFVKKYGHAWLLSYAFIYLAWFFHLEETTKPPYNIIHIALDDSIPFVEAFIIPYLLWFPYVAVTVAYFFFTSKNDYYRLCAFLFTGMTISLLVCTLFPNGTNFRPHIDPDKNIFCLLVSKLWKADTCTNVFPSIHVYNSIGAHLAISRCLSGLNTEQGASFRKWLRAGSFLLCVSIILATIFLKQHSVFDVITAFILAGAMYGVLYRNDRITLQRQRRSSRRRVRA